MRGAIWAKDPNTPPQAAIGPAGQYAAFLWAAQQGHSEMQRFLVVAEHYRLQQVATSDALCSSIHKQCAALQGVWGTEFPHIKN